MKQKVLYTAITLAASVVCGAENPGGGVPDPTPASGATAAGAGSVQSPRTLEDVPVIQEEGANASDTPWPRGVFMDVTVGTQGIGMDVGYSFNKYLKLRVRGTYFPKYERTDEWDDISVDSSFKSNSCGLILDYHPWGESFRISAGLCVSPLKVEADGSLNDAFQGGTYRLGNYEYTVNGAGHLRGKYEWETVQPYIGIGWSCSSKSRHAWYFTADIGVNIMGKGDLSVSYDGQVTQRNMVTGEYKDHVDLGQLEGNIREEGKDAFEIADKIVVYPVLHFGAGCRF